MKPRARFAAWLAAVFGAVVALVAAVVALVTVGHEAGQHAAMVEALDERAPLLGFLALLAFIGCAGLLRWLAARYVAPLRALAEQARIVATANSAHRLPLEGPPEVAELASAVNQLAEAYRAQGAETAERVAEAGARLEEERNRLAALMSDLSEGVLVCNPEGRILLYNEQARSLFTPAAAGRVAPQSPVGLGRSVFAFLDRDQVAHALDKVRYRLDREGPSPMTVFLTTSAAGGLVRVRLAPVLAADGAMGGMVLTMEDVTAAFGQEAQRRSLLQALATRVRQPAANVRAAAENLFSYPQMSEAERARFTEIIAAESSGLSDTIDEALRAYADALKDGLSLEPMRLADLVDVARRRIDALSELRARGEPIDPASWVNVDSYAFVQVFAFLAERLRDRHQVREVVFRAAAKGAFVELDLAWDGAAVPVEMLAAWETEALQVGSEQTPLSMRQVLERHGGEVWHQSRPPVSWFRFLIPLAEPAPTRERRRVTAASRPEYYDFDLFRNGEAASSLAGQRLADLSYTVFDTETTGVEPSAGDKIISIGAVRIVNGRLLKHEVFEQLVDPRRPISRQSVAIHGIRSSDLAGQPVIGEVLPAFHRFCEDTVLVAHNAAFDMRFLELGEAESGVRFTQPVLDTLLLSAAVHRDLEDHSLEAIAARLGVPIVGRHTALGDALMTSEIFLKLVALLAERGIETLGEALAAARETYYVRLQY